VPLLTLLAVVAFVLAVIGYEGSFGSRLLDALRLFPSGFPGRPPPGEDWTLTTARNLAAVLSAAGLIAAILALYSRQLTGVRARSRQRHAVVCGLGEKGIRTVRALRARGLKVTCIDLDGLSDAAEDARARGAIVVAGDATASTSLSRAAVARASIVVCACDDDRVNARIAARVVGLVDPRRKSRLTVFVHVSEPELKASLDALSHSIASVRMEFFNIYDLWARALVDVADLGADGRPPHIVVVGCTPLGHAVAVAAAREWRSVRGGPDERVRVTLLDPSAGTNAARLSSRYPALARSAEIVAVEQVVSSGNPVDFAVLIAQAPATAVFLCLTDDGDNLALALDARNQLGTDVAVVIPGTAWAGAFTSLLPPHSGILAVGYAEEVDALDLLDTSNREELAREVHAHYRTSDDPSSVADVSWAELSEDLREANRAQVDGLERGLRALWFRIMPAFDWDVPTVDLTDAQIEALAEVEHERWCRERRAAGWRFGDERDVTARRHPDLVAWADLSNASREKDRRAVREWPAILARAGRRLAPNEQRERLAKQIHARHRAARAAAGELAPPEWEALDESTRRQNRESADDIALKLLRVGCTLAPAWDDAPTTSLSTHEIEVLAELEHERWCRSKVAHGWRLGPQRNDASKVHPDLVDWEDLPDGRREIDREHVRAIPELLHDVGLKAVRDKPNSLRRDWRWARHR